jgi:predicted AlkP superfamily phosphohydrolase/phosphomutase
MTGNQSGDHGIFGFMDFEPNSYKMYFPNFSHLKSETLWNNIAKQNKKSIVINMPATYPAKQINGALISGFVAIDIDKAVYPASIIPSLKKIDYRIDIDTIKARHDHEFLFRDLDNTLKMREKAVHFLWVESEWDLFIVVITGTDRLMHFLWDAYEDEDHRYHNDFMNYFKKVDSFVGNVYDRFANLKNSQKKPNQFFMLSDHGFTGIKTEVYLNQWLKENGLLKFAKADPKTIMDIGQGSTAFVLDPSRIYINLKDKYPLGTVASSDYKRVCLELKEGLESLTFDENSHIAKKVYFKEELYKGIFFDLAPDLVILSNYGYDLKGKVNSDNIFGHSGLVGMHTQDDAFFFNSNGDQCDTIFNVKELIKNVF